MPTCSYYVYESSKNVREACGDVFFYKQEENSLLFGVIDGLGHGEEAHQAAIQAKDFFLRSQACLEDLLLESHAHLIGTRGAVATLVRLDFIQKKIEWAGIGNITATMIDCLRNRPPKTAVTKSGCLGFSSPSSIFVQTFDLPPHAIFILNSDGILEPTTPPFHLPSTPLTKDILEECGYRFLDDDQLILFVEYTDA